MTAIIFTLFFVFFVGTSVVPFLVNSKKTSFITMISLFWIVGFGALGLQMFYYVILNIPWNILYIILPWVIPFILSIRKLQSESFTIPKFKGNIIEKILLALILGLFLFTVPPARLFAGTSGSFGIGFLLASIAILSGTKIATTLLVLAVPMTDAAWVFFDRIRSGASPFRGNDRRHLHFRLRELGWSDRSIVLLYVGITAFAGFGALVSRAIGKFAVLLLVFSLIFFLLLRIHRAAEVRRRLTGK